MMHRTVITIHPSLIEQADYELKDHSLNQMVLALAIKLSTLFLLLLEEVESNILQVML